MHTHWSDGSGTIAEMAAAARERGYEYIAITDHSKGLKIAGGIDENALEKQGAKIAATNENLRLTNKGVTVLRSVELNLNARGEGDVDPAALRQLDLVLESFHSSLRTPDDQTARYPDRQDLNLSLLKIARKEGVLVSLGTDAHHAWQFGFIELGLAAACRAKIPASHVLNFMPLSQLRAWADSLPNRLD